jgi:hypothetical protein
LQALQTPSRGVGPRKPKSTFFFHSNHKKVLDMEFIELALWILLGMGGTVVLAEVIWISCLIYNMERHSKRKTQPTPPAESHLSASEKLNKALPVLAQQSAGWNPEQALKSLGKLPTVDNNSVPTGVNLEGDCDLKKDL